VGDCRDHGGDRGGLWIATDPAITSIRHSGTRSGDALRQTEPADEAQATKGSAMNGTNRDAERTNAMAGRAAPSGTSSRSGDSNSLTKQALKYAQCMRSGGVDNFADPTPGNSRAVVTAARCSRR
jgi:hypothetical protein